jgi:hypothetical protein
MACGNPQVYDDAKIAVKPIIPAIDPADLPADWNARIMHGPTRIDRDGTASPYADPSLVSA